MTGHTSYHAGLAAEDIVARDYTGRAHQVAARRWRGKSGEIDLIMRDGDTLVFVEVKKSTNFAQAALRLGRRQMDRLCASASEYLAGEPMGQLTDMRFDLALVDRRGAVNVIENAFMEA
ncbi:YraN family protein [Yoonia vestfoldensis]|uniref:YraN family protein n=1 Tax=Yoonia vestfoldensis TaxID=245188 RepID=UPI00036E87B4|nr:YraN family protein [Yoonia vestfoldensis]